MLIPFPIGLWVFSLVADLVYLLGGNAAWKDWIAFYALAGGIIGAVAAAVSGIIDWLSIKDCAVKKTADWHARLTVIALLESIRRSVVNPELQSSFVASLLQADGSSRVS